MRRGEIGAPRLALTALRADRGIIGTVGNYTPRNHRFTELARSIMRWARARTGLITVVSLAMACRMGTTAGHFFQTVAGGCFLHALQFLIERQLLVTMEILQPAAEFQRQGEALEELGYLLHRSHGRVVVGGGRTPPGVLVGQGLASRWTPDSSSWNLFLPQSSAPVRPVRKPVGGSQRTWKSPGGRDRLRNRDSACRRNRRWSGRRRKLKSHNAKARSRGNRE